MFDLVRARSHFARLAYLRSAAPDHARLRSTAKRVSPQAEGARAALEDALDLIDVPAVEDARARLGAWARVEARTSMSEDTRLDNLPFGKVVDSNTALREILRELAVALPG